ncbi:hypothetical protein D3C78_1392170 [compost metagenome]
MPCEPAPFQMSSMVCSPWGRSVSLSVEHPARTQQNTLIQVRQRSLVFFMANAPALGLVVDGDLMVEVQGDLCCRWHVHGSKGFAIQFVDPLADVADPTTEN